MPVCEIDLKAGGSYRYVWRSDDGAKEFGTGGVFHEIVAPERFVVTEKMDGFPGEGALVTQSLAEHGGRTTLTLTMRFDSKESRDGALATGMAEGVATSYDRMDEVLASALVQAKENA